MVGGGFGNIFKIPELKKRILITLGLLIIYLVGVQVPTPGIDAVALASFFERAKEGLLGLFNMFSGGALSRFTIFALGIMPYISASIIFQVLGSTFPTIEKLQKEGEDGRRKLTQWTRYSTVFLCIMQAYGYSIFLESQPGVVVFPGWAFRIETVLLLTAGGVFVMWLG